MSAQSQRRRAPFSRLIPATSPEPGHVQLRSPHFSLASLTRRAPLVSHNPPPRGSSTPPRRTRHSPLPLAPSFGRRRIAAETVCPTRKTRSSTDLSCTGLGFHFSTSATSRTATTTPGGTQTRRSQTMFAKLARESYQAVEHSGLRIRGVVPPPSGHHHPLPTSRGHRAAPPALTTRRQFRLHGFSEGTACVAHSRPTVTAPLQIGRAHV